MKQLLNNYCIWIHLMPLDPSPFHLPLNHLLFTTIKVMVDEPEEGVDNIIVFVVTITTVTVTLKLIVIQRQENNSDNQGLLSLLNWRILKTLQFPPHIYYNDFL